MHTIIFDTLKYAKTLEANGFSAEQAEALAEQNKIVFNEFAENQLASKGDLFKVKEELKGDLFKVKAELQGDISRLDKELAVVKWVSFATFALVGLSLARDLLSL
ncbi:CCDC90 family protein [Thiomicrospira microaerophila]|uniref:DUF1640 domain-containing protein n=1 Tax=Thiomicrospira microaerophila TaxID=406020 RepID=UPI0005C90EA0|nr:DUF1640 domain-containing protein [Thiomicrospira microaerophila]